MIRALALGLACALLAPQEYPRHWTPAPKEGAPAWEILPQEATFIRNELKQP